MQRRGEESHECWSRLDYQMVSCQGLNQLSNSNLNLSSSSALRQHNLGTLAVYRYLKNISSLHHLCSAPSCFAYCSPPTRSTPSASDSIYNSLMTLKILLAPAIAVSNELQQSCINPRPIVQVKLLRAALHSTNWLLMELEGKNSSLHSRVDRQRTQNAKCTLVVCP